MRNVVKRVVASPAGFKSLKNMVAIAICLAGMTMFSGCDKDPNEETPDDVEGLTVTGDVFIGQDNVQPQYAPYIPYTGEDLTVKVEDSERYKIGSGEIKGGKLNFTLGTPKNPKKMAESEFMDYIFRKRYESTSITYSDPNAKCDYLILDPRVVIADTYVFLQKTNYISMTSTTNTSTQIEVFYVYVDKDVTITATGFHVGAPSSEHLDVRLPLRKGWNELYEKHTSTYIPSTDIYSWGMGDEGCKWVLW